MRNARPRARAPTRSEIVPLWADCTGSALVGSWMSRSEVPLEKVILCAPCLVTRVSRSSDGSQVIWARQLVSPQPKSWGRCPVAERARAVEFGPCGEATARWRSLYFMCEYGRVRHDLTSDSVLHKGLTRPVTHTPTTHQTSSGSRSALLRRCPPAPGPADARWQSGAGRAAIDPENRGSHPSRPHQSRSQKVNQKQLLW